MVVSWGVQRLHCLDCARKLFEGLWRHLASPRSASCYHHIALTTRFSDTYGTTICINLLICRA